MSGSRFEYVMLPEAEDNEDLKPETGFPLPPELTLIDQDTDEFPPLQEEFLIKDEPEEDCDVKWQDEETIWLPSTGQPSLQGEEPPTAESSNIAASSAMTSNDPLLPCGSSYDKTAYYTVTHLMTPSTQLQQQPQQSSNPRSVLKVSSVNRMPVHRYIPVTSTEASSSRNNCKTLHLTKVTKIKTYSVKTNLPQKKINQNVHKNVQSNIETGRFRKIIPKNGPTNFHCINCKRDYDNDLVFKFHWCVANCDVLYCNSCPKKFDTSNEFKNHIIENHYAHNDYVRTYSGLLPVVKLQRVEEWYTGKVYSPPPTFTCCVCRHVTKTKKLLKNHIKSHFKLTSFKCKFCSIKFKLQFALKIHLKEFHKIKISQIKSKKKIIKKHFKCKTCNLETNSEFALELHMKKHSKIACESVNILPKISKQLPNCSSNNQQLEKPSSKKSYKCKVCNESLSSKSEAQKHMLRFHCSGDSSESSDGENEKFVCKKCNFACSKQSELANHVKVHVTNKLKCKYCEESFVSEIEMKKHFSMTHESIINLDTTEKTLEIYDNSNQVSDNDIYDDTQNSDNEISNETTSKENNSINEETTRKKFGTLRHRNNNEKFICNLCNQTFDTSYHLHSHSQTVHGNIYVEPKSRGTGTGAFKCNECGRGFSQLSILRHHKLRHRNVKPYPCKFLCGKRYASGSGVSSHYLLEHAGETVPSNLESLPVKINTEYVLDNEKSEKMIRFACNLCNIKFKTFKLLHKHSKSHDISIKQPNFRKTDGPFKCIICKNGFGNLCSLRQHEVRHKNIKPYRCTYCSKMYANKAGLLYHFGNVHKKKRDADRKKAILEKESSLEIESNNVMRSTDYEDGSENEKIEGENVPKKNETKQQGGERDRHCGETELSSSQTTKQIHRGENINSKNPCDVLQENIDLESDKNSDSESDDSRFEIDIQSRSNRLVDYFLCNLCDTQFKSFKTLHKHSKLHDTPIKQPKFRKIDGPFKCSICKNGYVRLGTLRQHEVRHKNIKPYRCVYCGKVFANKGALLHHLESAHKDQREADKKKLKYVKKRCSGQALENIEDESAESVMEKIHGDEENSQDNYEIVCENSMDVEYDDRAEENQSNYVTQDDEINNYKETESNSSQMSIQREYIASETAFRVSQRNIEIENNENSESEIDDIDDDFARKIHPRNNRVIDHFICNLCNIKFKSCNALYEHSIKHEIPTKKQPKFRINTGKYNCSICVNSYSSLTHLKLHEIRHRNIKPFPCIICNKAYANRAGLQYHYDNVHEKKMEEFKNRQKEENLLNLIGREKESTNLSSKVDDINNEDTTEQYSTEDRIHDNSQQIQNKSVDEQKEDEEISEKIEDADKLLPNENINFDSDEELTSLLDAVNYKPTTVMEQSTSSPPPMESSSEKLEILVDPELLCNKNQNNRNGRKLYCNLCKITFKNPKLLFSHSQKYHKDVFVQPKVRTTDGNFECDECESSFTTVKNLEHHKLRHRNIKAFTCNFCTKIYANYAGLHYHYKKHHLEAWNLHLKNRADGNYDSFLPPQSEKNTEVPKPETSTTSETSNLQKSNYNYVLEGSEYISLPTDKNKSIILACHECNLEFKNKTLLFKHCQIVHNTVKFQPIVKKDTDGPFKCNECTSGFKSLSHLKHHKMRHRNIKAYACKYCGKLYANPAGLHYHYWHVHPEEKMRDGQLTNTPQWYQNMLNRYSKPQDTNDISTEESSKVDDKICTSQGELNKANKATGKGTKNRVRCNFCDKSFAYKTVLTSHLINIHDVEVPRETEKKYIEKKKHKIKVLNYACNKCKIPFQTLKLLYNHCQEKHKHVSVQLKPRPDITGGNFKCKECGQKYEMLHSYHLHIIRHRNIKPFYCRFCKKSYANAAGLSYHHGKSHYKKRESSEMNKNNKEVKRNEIKNVKSNHINSTFLNFKTPQDNSITVNSMHCKSCNETFTNRTEYYKHIKSVHNIIFTCHHCSKSFSKKLNLKEHMKIHIQYNKRLRIPSITNICGEEVYVCTLCAETFKTKHLFIIHKNNHAKNFICDICGERYTTETSLQAHKMYQHEPPKFLCSECGEKFTTNFLLKLHTKAHEDLKFPCQQCPKKFISRPLLRTHVNLEHREQCFFCNICGISLGRKDELGRHLRIHSNIKPFSCPHCQKQFKTKVGWKHHVNVVHKLGEK